MQVARPSGVANVHLTWEGVNQEVSSWARTFSRFMFNMDLVLVRLGS